MSEETPEVEEVSGFSIPVRELTKAEANRKITWQRFKEFHYAAGEDFFDTTGEEGNIRIFCGYMLAKYPEFRKEILEIANDRFGSMLEFTEIEIFGYDEAKDIDFIYCEFADFCNLTEALKKRVNQILIQVTEYYNR